MSGPLIKQREDIWIPASGATQWTFALIETMIRVSQPQDLKVVCILANVKLVATGPSRCKLTLNLLGEGLPASTVPITTQFDAYTYDCNSFSATVNVNGVKIGNYLATATVSSSDQTNGLEIQKAYIVATGSA